MMTRSISIAAPSEIVWRIITEKDHVTGWMNRALVETTWMIGAPITFAGEFNGKRFQDHGAVLRYNPPSRLVYTYFSSWWRVPDHPLNYSTIDFFLSKHANGTVLSVTHDAIPTDAATNHAKFFWTNALADIRTLAEAYN